MLTGQVQVNEFLYDQYDHPNCDHLPSDKNTSGSPTLTFSQCPVQETGKKEIEGHFSATLCKYILAKDRHGIILTGTLQQY